MAIKSKWSHDPIPINDALSIVQSRLGEWCEPGFAQIVTKFSTTGLDKLLLYILFARWKGGTFCVRERWSFKDCIWVRSACERDPGWLFNQLAIYWSFWQVSFITHLWDNTNLWKKHSPHRKCCCCYQRWYNWDDLKRSQSPQRDLICANPKLWQLTKIQSCEAQSRRPGRGGRPRRALLGGRAGEGGVGGRGGQAEDRWQLGWQWVRSWGGVRLTTMASTLTWSADQHLLLSSSSLTTGQWPAPPPTEGW